jgi:hypothetical protein
MASEREATWNDLMSRATRPGTDLRPDDFPTEEDDLCDLMRGCGPNLPADEIADLDDHLTRICNGGRRGPPSSSSSDRAPADDAEGEPRAFHLNVVTRDNALHANLADEMKDTLLMFEGVELTYMLVSSWKIQRREFASADVLVNELRMRGLSLVDKRVDGGACVLSFSLDLHYEEKMRELAEYQEQKKEHALTMQIAAAAEYYTDLQAAANSEEYGTSGAQPSGSRPHDGGRRYFDDGDDDHTMGVGAQASTNYVDMDDIPGYVDDHIFLVVRMDARNTIRSAHLEARDEIPT